MFVYLLKHKTEPRFKIGKANDIPQRISSIGGRDSYDLIGSRCINARTPGNACRVERLLHRMFFAWHLPVKIAQRFIGDTEQFDIECFGAVIAFVEANKALLDIDAVDGLPLRQVVPPSRSFACRRDAVERKQKSSYEQRIETATNILSTAVKSLLSLKLDCCGIYAEEPSDGTAQQRRHYLCAAGYGTAFDVAGSVIAQLLQVGIPFHRNRGQFRLITESYCVYPSANDATGVHVARISGAYFPACGNGITSVPEAAFPASLGEILSQLPHGDFCPLSVVTSTSQRSASFRHALHVTFG